MQRQFLISVCILPNGLWFSVSEKAVHWKPVSWLQKLKTPVVAMGIIENVTILYALLLMIFWLFLVLYRKVLIISKIQMISSSNDTNNLED